MLTIIKHILLAFMALGLCLLLVAAVVTKEWLLIPVVLLPVWALFCPMDQERGR